MNDVLSHELLRNLINASYFLGGGEALGVRQLAAAFAREASFAHFKRRQAAALQGALRARTMNPQFPYYWEHHG